MEEWVHRSLKRWPNVPALFGWLRLDRRGRWLIQGEHITRPQIIDTINRNYAADEQGQWYFQNGPQRGYMELEYAPLVLRATADNYLVTHTELRVDLPSQAFMDEEGALLFKTEHGPAALIDDELEWALQRISVRGQPIDETRLAEALVLPSGSSTQLELCVGDKRLPIQRLDAADAPEKLSFVRVPEA
jgi:hypothetical protein